MESSYKGLDVGVKLKTESKFTNSLTSSAITSKLFVPTVYSSLMKTSTTISDATMGVEKHKDDAKKPTAISLSKPKTASYGGSGTVSKPSTIPKPSCLTSVNTASKPGNLRSEVLQSSSLKSGGHTLNTALMSKTAKPACLQTSFSSLQCKSSVPTGPSCLKTSLRSEALTSAKLSTSIDTSKLGLSLSSGDHVGMSYSLLTKSSFSSGMQISSACTRVDIMGHAKSGGGKNQTKTNKSKTKERILESDIDIPYYDFQSGVRIEWTDEKTTSFLPPEKDRTLAKLTRPITDIETIKRGLINAVSGSLIRAPDFKESRDPLRLELIAVSENVAAYDPEFILKASLYTRQELNIRTTANFLLAYAANNRACRPFLRKYYQTTIRLPSDWIDVAEQYQAFYDRDLKSGSLPSALRKVMITKFPDFDKYQLGKYNKDSSGKKQRKKERKAAKRAAREAAKAGQEGSGQSDDVTSATRGARGGRGGRGGRGAVRGGRGGRGGAVARNQGRPTDQSSSSSSSDSSSDEEETAICRQISGLTEGSDNEEEVARRSFTLKKLIRKLHISGLTEGSDNEEQIAQRSFTLKQLIRKLHVTEPVEHVMCLIGKRYPATSDDFYLSRLPGAWEPDRAGKRMKLPTPETWETQVSMKGNKAKTWEDLIDHKKLPFMAMLRNLRNMIKAGVSNKHHDWVIRKLTNEGAVVSSRQFPFRFFSAYEVLEQLEKDYTECQEQIIQAATLIAEGKSPAPRGRGARGRGRGGRGGRGGGRGGGAFKIGPDGMPEELPYDTALTKRYRTALDKAVKIATVHNVKPIKGRTLIFVNLGPNMDRPCSSAKGLGKPRTVKDVGVLLGLMCKYSCEECLYVGYGSRTHIEIELEKGTILHNMERVLTNPEVNQGGEGQGSRFPDHYLSRLLIDRSQVDNLVILSDRMTKDSAEGQSVTQFLDFYRRIVNPNLLFISVDLSGAQSGIDNTIEPGHDNDVYIAGYSDQILRFIAERGDSGQLTHVEHIDTAYNLKPMPPGLLQASGPAKRPPNKDKIGRVFTSNPIPRWRTIRVFISSTFRDMHGERDLLTRYVFPELRARARQHRLHVFEVDLRWGVTEEVTRGKQAVQVCLTQVARSHLFVGMLGERYGWVPDSYQAEGEEFAWLEDYPSGRSVTELEMELAALRRPRSARKTAFFYMRDNSLLENAIPKRCRQDFVAESAEAKKKMDDLKQRIRNSGLEVYDGYPCVWGGVADGKPMVASLEELGKRVLNNLWTALENKFVSKDSVLDELSHARAQHETYMASFLDTFAGRAPLVKNVLSSMRSLQNGGLLVLAGKAGSGKSAIVASAVDQWHRSHTDQAPAIVHFMGAAPGSTHIIGTLQRLVNELCAQFSLDHVPAEEYKNLVPQWHEILKAAGECGVGPVLVVIDGLDLLEDTHGARSLDWLPQPVPKGVLLVVSLCSDGDCCKQLKRLNDVTLMPIGPLQLLDKADVARRLLAAKGKSLNEEAFGNQMKLLVNKREASSPFYLSLACHELCLFGVFEKLTGRLKQLSQTVSQLLQEVLIRLESDHGEELASSALCLLACSPAGLQLEHLREALSYSLLLKVRSGGCRMGDVRNIELSTEQVLPHATFLPLVTGLQGLLRPSPDKDSTVLALSHREVEDAVRLRYFKAGLLDGAVETHKLLAGFYWLLADPDKNASWKGASPRAFAFLPTHLARAGLYAELEQVLCDLRFIYAKCRHGLAPQLMQDFHAHELGGKSANKAREAYLKSPRLQAYRSFIGAHIHVLREHPELLWQQAVNQPTQAPPCQQVKAIQGAGEKLRLVEWLNKPSDSDPCVYTVSNMAQEITCVAISQDSRHFATGGLDCLVKLFELDTGKLVREFTGHSGAITCICFVGSDRLCSASADDTMSLWSTTEGHRIKVMTQHNRQVASCAADSKGKVLVSAGWDSTLRVWKAGSGEFDYDLSRDQSPYSCVAWHPDDSLIVTGSWDAAIRIFDVYNKVRRAVLRGHLTSVRSVAYSPDGRHIVSASLEGEVRLWWAASGTQVGVLSGHARPVNGLTFTSDGHHVITVADDHKIKVWSGRMGQLVNLLRDDSTDVDETTTSGQSEKEVIAKHIDETPNAVTSVALYGDSLAVGYHAGNVRVYRVSSGMSVWEQAAHTAAVTVVRISRNARHLVTGSADNAVKVWNMSDWNLVSVLTGHQAGVLAAVCGDYWLVSTSHDCSAAIYQMPMKMSRSTAPLKICRAHTAPVSGCDMNQSESVLVTVGRDTEMMFWNLNGNCRAPVHVISACHLDWVTCCSWSDTGDFLVTGSGDMSLKVWDLKTVMADISENQKEVKKTSETQPKFVMQGHQAAVNSVAYSHGCIVSCGADGLVKVWSHRGVEITTLHGHKGSVHACAMLVSLGEKLEEEEEDNDGASDWATMTEMDDWQQQHEKVKVSKVNKVRANADVLVASGADDCCVRLWRPLLGRDVCTMTGHSDRVLALAATTENRLVTSSRDKSLKVWQPPLEPKTPEQEQLDEEFVKGEHHGEVSAIAVNWLSESQAVIVTAAREATLKVWHKPSDNEEPQCQTSIQDEDKQPISGLAFLPIDSRGDKRLVLQLAACTEGGVIALYGIMVNKGFAMMCLKRIVEKCPDPVHPFTSIHALSYNRLATTNWRGEVQIWDWITGQGKAAHTFQLHQSTIMSASQCGEWLHTGGADETVQSHKIVPQGDISTTVQRIRNEAGQSHLPPRKRKANWITATAQSGSTLFVGDVFGRLGSFKAGTASTGEPQMKQVHAAAITAMATTDHVVFTASRDGTIKAWSGELQQLWQYICPSPVTSLLVLKHDSRGAQLVCGDLLGNANFLNWTA